MEGREGDGRRDTNTSQPNREGESLSLLFVPSKLRIFNCNITWQGYEEAG